MITAALTFMVRYWRPLAGLAAVLAVIAAVLFYGARQYERGVNDERAKHAAAAIEAARDRGQVDSAVAALPDGSAVDELRRHWSRD